MAINGTCDGTYVAVGCHRHQSKRVVHIIGIARNKRGSLQRIIHRHLAVSAAEIDRNAAHAAAGRYVRPLPLSARLTPELRASLVSQNDGALIPENCRITRLHYLGDEGGIVCKLDLGEGVEKDAYVSITHLRFDPRPPMNRKIIAYQKHRVKRLQRQAPVTLAET